MYAVIDSRAEIVSGTPSNKTFGDAMQDLALDGRPFRVLVELLAYCNQPGTESPYGIDQYKLMAELLTGADDDNDIRGYYKAGLIVDGVDSIPDALTALARYLSLPDGSLNRLGEVVIGRREWWKICPTTPE
jgi:hypothetical protein